MDLEGVMSISTVINALEGVHHRRFWCKFHFRVTLAETLAALDSLDTRLQGQLRLAIYILELI